MGNNFSTSDFITDDLPQTEQRKFSHVQKVYLSSSGYNCIFQGERYGKLHILKTLQPDYATLAFYQKALQKEFNIGYQLEHPHICRTLGWENVEGIGQCIILEYVDGLTLKDLMDEGKLTKELAEKIIMELCEALQYLHKKQIVHRDLKPSNILITHNGNNVKLIDFGLSDCDDYDILKLPAGTRYYLAPEVLIPGSPLDSRSDIYSLGIILGEMASILNDKNLASISRKCTQRSPEKRYTSTSEIIDNMKGRKSWTYPQGILALVITLIVLSTGIYFSQSKPQQFQPSYPVYGTTISIGRNCRDILMEERNNLRNKRGSKDSARITLRLKEALDKNFPKPEQRTSSAYLLQWEKIQEEIARLLTES